MSKIKATIFLRIVVILCVKFKNLMYHQLCLHLLLQDLCLLTKFTFIFMDVHSLGLASLVAQSVKNLPAVQETGVQTQGWDDPLVINCLLTFFISSFCAQTMFHIPLMYNPVYSHKYQHWPDMLLKIGCKTH